MYRDLSLGSQSQAPSQCINSSSLHRRISNSTCISLPRSHPTRQDSNSLSPKLKTITLIGSSNEANHRHHIRRSSSRQDNCQSVRVMCQDSCSNIVLSNECFPSSTILSPVQANGIPPL